MHLCKADKLLDISTCNFHRDLGEILLTSLIFVIGLQHYPYWCLQKSSTIPCSELLFLKINALYSNTYLVSLLSQFCVRLLSHLNDSRLMQLTDPSWCLHMYWSISLVSFCFTFSKIISGSFLFCGDWPIFVTNVIDLTIGCISSNLINITQSSLSHTFSLEISFSGLHQAVQILCFISCPVDAKMWLFLRLLKKFDFPSMKFSLYFMGYEDAADIPSDEGERSKWLFSRRATLELTQYRSFSCTQSNKLRLPSSLHWFNSLSHSNWGTEDDPNFKGYHNGNSEPKGFGELMLLPWCCACPLLFLIHCTLLLLLCRSHWSCGE